MLGSVFVLEKPKRRWVVKSKRNVKIKVYRLAFKLKKKKIKMQVQYVVAF